MKAFEANDYPVFSLFNNRWGLVTAGTADAFNACTLSWGSLGTIWGGPGQGRPIVTIYVHPDRYTHTFLRNNDRFTVSFFPETCRKALEYLGSHSGRKENKIAAAGLTPIFLENGVAYEEATLTLVCRKLYEGPFAQEGLADEIGKGIYDSREPHWIFVGEILEAREKAD